MAFYYNGPSRTFSEYLLVPNLSTKECIPSHVSLKTPLVKFCEGESPKINLDIPFVSSIMQAVSDDRMAISLSRNGGLSFIYGSQSIESQSAMVARVKNYKAGFVTSDTNVTPTTSMKEVLETIKKTGHSTVAITDNGEHDGKLIGLLASKDFRIGRIDSSSLVNEFMTKIDDLIIGADGITLSEANNIIWDNKLNCLPVITEEGNMRSLVFRKDYDLHKQNPNELLDEEKRLLVGAGINTRDYKTRVPSLVESGADVLCIDSSDGFSEWQSETIQWIKTEYGETVKVGAGNIVDKDGFRYLVDAGADFIKVGIGPGSICITREQKGIGRGQASALIEVNEARNKYFSEKKVYIPICSDGGIVYDYHITLALAMGADFVMMGRYFARFDESPTKKVLFGSKYVKEYWAEGSNRARNWQRYDVGGNMKLEFEEGVDSYVPYAGSLKENVGISINKIKSTMCNCGVLTIEELRNKARLTLISSVGIREGSTHDIILKDNIYGEHI
jgi:IMP dehydrogenase